MDTKLLIEGQEVDLGEAIVARSYRNNLLSELGSVDSNYSNVFSVPATAKNEQLFKHASKLNSTSDTPYLVMDATLLSDGVEEIPFALCELQKYKNRFYDLQVFSGAVQFFDKLGDLELSDLSWPELEHNWTFDNIAANLDGANGVFLYDLYHRGMPVDLTRVNCWHMHPSTYVKAIWNKIFETAGFTYDLLPNEKFEKLKLPTVELFSYDEKYMEARQFKVTSADGDRIRATLHEERMFFGHTKELYPVDANGGYDLVNHRYVVDTPRWMTFSAGASVYVNAGGGSEVRGIIKIKVNGVTMADARLESGFSGSKTQFLTVTTGNLLLNTGDIVEAWFQLDNVSDVVFDPDSIIHYTATGSQTPYFSGTVLPNFPYRGIVRVQDWLPKMKQKDFIIAIMNLFGFGFYPDAYNNLIKVRQLKDIEANIPNAVIWSGKIDFKEEPELSYTIPGYAKNNHFVYKEDDNTQEGFGNGVLIVDNQRLEKAKDLIKLPFAATEMRDGYPFVPMFEVKGGTDPVEYERIKSEPRIVIEHGEVTGTLVQIEPHPIDIGEELITDSAEVTFKTSYFSDATMPYDLNLQRIIDADYAVLKGMLDRAKFIKAIVNLKASDIANLDFLKPIWLNEYQEYFYLEQIIDYSGPGLTEVELIRL